MSTLALKVVSPSPAAPLGRQNLVAALARREETLKAYQAASAAVDRLRGLIDEETKAKAALAALEEVSADSAGAWARGDVATLEIPSEAAIDGARRELGRTSRLADAARGAMAGAVAAAASWGAPRSAAVTQMLEISPRNFVRRGSKDQGASTRTRNRFRKMRRRDDRDRRRDQSKPASGRHSGRGRDYLSHRPVDQWGPNPRPGAVGAAA